MTTVPMIPTQLNTQLLALIDSSKGAGTAPATPLVPTVQILQSAPAAGTRVNFFNNNSSVIYQPNALPVGTNFYKDASGKVFADDVSRPFQNPYAQYAADRALSDYFSQPGKEVLNGIQDNFTKQEFLQLREYNADIQNGRTGGLWLNEQRRLTEKLERTIAPGSATPANPNATAVDPILTIGATLANVFGFNPLQSGSFNPLTFTKNLIQKYTQPTTTPTTPPVTDSLTVSANALATAAEISSRTTYLGSTVGVFTSRTDAVNYTLNFNGKSKAADDVAIVLNLRREFSGSSGTEPPRVCRRPFGLSYAAMAGASSMA